MISSSPVAARSRFATLLFLVPFALLGFSSASSPSQDSAEQRENSAQKFVDQKLRIWKERLNLESWNIEAKLVRPDSLEPKTLGNIHWDTNTKRATIGVLSTYNYHLPEQEMLADMEFTIVHELVHLHLATLPRSDASRSHEERAVNELTRAMLKLAAKQ